MLSSASATHNSCACSYHWVLKFNEYFITAVFVLLATLLFCCKHFSDAVGIRPLLDIVCRLNV